MPFSVEHLIEGSPTPAIIAQEEPVTKALTLMIEHDYSQLPVTDTDHRPIGMITYEGILRGIRNFQAQLNDLHVRDVLVSAPLFNLEDDLFELLEKLKLTNAVLIVDPTGKLVGIVTSYDSTEYFRNRAEHMMRVEDIEVMIKDFILLAYTGDDGEINQANLDKAVSKVTSHEKPQVPKGFDDLSLNQYITILTGQQKWSFFDPIFKVTRVSVMKLLDGVRQTRNDLAHFRSDITSDQADQLRFCAEWLARCWEGYEKIKAQDLPNYDEKTSRIEQKVDIVPETAIGDQTLTDQQSVSIIAEEAKPRQSRYAPLADWLQSQPGRINEVKLTFNQIEEIIGGSLPASAHTHRAWWANDSHSHVQSQIWLEVGWRRTYLNMTNQQVTFVRIREREKAYIKFFSSLLAELRQETDFPVRDVSPDGASWIVAQTVSPGRSVVGQFNFSFTRDRRLRVELYLDTYNKETTKKLFDRIRSHKEELEAELGQISWERIDDKRASRIAIYHPGAILDDQKELETLKKWAATTMSSFYKALEPLATQAVQEVLSS